MSALFRFRLRRYPSTQWALHDYVLYDGEPGWDSTLKRLKIGDGVTAWTALGWVDEGGGAAIIPAASTTVQGKVELATSAEGIAGTDTARAMTPAASAAALVEFSAGLAPVAEPKAVDFGGRATRSFVPARDLPNVVRAYDPSLFPSSATVADGTPVTLLPDQSGQGQDLVQSTAANAPRLGTVNGRRFLDMSDGVAYSTRRTMAVSSTADNQFPRRGSTFSQPISHIALVKIATDDPTGASVKYVVAGNIIAPPTAGWDQNVGLGITTTEHMLFTGAGSNVVKGGPNLHDGQWHVLAVVVAPTWAACYVDGFQVAQSTTTLGSFVLAAYALGNGADDFYGQLRGGVGPVVTCNAALTGRQVLDATKSILADWGLTNPTPTRQEGVTYTTSTISGQAANIWMPGPGRLKVTNGKATLFLLSHGAGANQTMPPNPAGGLPQYSLPHMIVNEGWIMASSNMHGDNWGSDAGIADQVALATQVKNSLPTGVGLRVILMGGSMGGLATMTMLGRGDVESNSIGTTAGAYFIDSVLDLQAAYNLDGAHATAINTAYSVGSYAAIPAGHNPMTRSTSDYSGKLMRFVASAADTQASKTVNTDAFRTKVAGVATEASLLTHILGHVGADAWQPADLYAFALRCGA